MLSSPPCAFAAATSAVGRGLGIAVGLEDRRGDLVLGEHVREAVRAEEDEVAELAATVKTSTSIAGSVPTARGDRRALGMPLRLLGGEDAALHELRDERVVGRDLLEHVSAQPIGARVADMAEHDPPRGRRRTRR